MGRAADPSQLLITVKMESMHNEAAWWLYRLAEPPTTGLGRSFGKRRARAEFQLRAGETWAEIAGECVRGVLKRHKHLKI